MNNTMTTRLLLTAYLTLALLCVATGAYLRTTPGPPDYPTLGRQWEPVKPQHSCGVWKYKYLQPFYGMPTLKDCKTSPDSWWPTGAALPRAPQYSSIGR